MRMKPFYPRLTIATHLTLKTPHALTLLFILEDVINAIEHVHQLELFCSQKRSSDPLSLLLFRLGNLLQNLLVCSLPQGFVNQGDFLNKLCIYSEILLKSTKSKDLQLLLLLEQMKETVCKTRPRFVMTDSMEDFDELCQNLLESCKFLHSSLISFMTLLIPFLKTVKSDETVLMYLVEKKESLNKYLGNHWVEHLIRFFFSDHLPLFHDTLKSGFLNRGFEAFYREKKELIQQVENDIACLPNPLTI